MSAIRPLIYRPKEAAIRRGCSLSEIWRQARTNPAFPRILKFSDSISGFDAEEFDAYILREIEAARERTKRPGAALKRTSALEARKIKNAKRRGRRSHSTSKAAATS